MAGIAGRIDVATGRRTDPGSPYSRVSRSRDQILGQALPGGSVWQQGARVPKRDAMASVGRHPEEDPSGNRGQAEVGVQTVEGRTAALQVPDRVPARAFPKLEIEVRHSSHLLKVMRSDPTGNMDTVFQCRVGLGGPGFPTPTGTYYVSHIYDKDPWWIPPDNRAWAAGQSPSRKIYGGTMAPLLKKRLQRTSRKEALQSEDKIAGKVQVDDWGYRFHGTNAPRSIGSNASHGCVRMLPSDARRVAELIKEQVGTKDQQRESENGSFVVLRAPVILTIVD